MTMTQLQRDALARAKAGDWELADAMELVERAKIEAPHAVVMACGGYEEEASLLYGVVDGNRMRFLAWGDASETECQTCDGKGETECGECGHTEECEDCDGEGTTDGDVVVHCFTDMNGNVLTESAEPAQRVTRTIKWARETLQTYHAEQNELARNAVGDAPIMETA